MATAKSQSGSSIAQNFMQFRFVSGQPTLTKKDERVSNDVTMRHGCSREAGNFSKALLVRDGELKALSGLVQKARRLVKEYTTPWEDGWRLVDVTKEQELTLKLEALRDEFDRQVLQAKANYDERVLRAAQELGTLFNPEDYMSRDEFVQKFQFSWEAIPIADAGQLNKLASMSKEQRKRLAEKMEADIQAKAAQAQTDVFRGLLKELGEMTAKFDGDKPINRKTFGNLKRLVALIPAKNLTGDKSLADAHAALTTTLKGIKVEDVKQDKAKREKVAKAGKKALADIEKGMKGFAGKAPAKDADK